MLNRQHTALSKRAGDAADPAAGFSVSDLYEYVPPAREPDRHRDAGPDLVEIDVDGHRNVVAREGAGDITVLLVHGAGAHRMWWDLVTPALTPDHQVLTIDLGGHGDSDWRPAYGPSVHAREIERALGLATGPVVLVGHSMGGRGSTIAAAAAPDRVAGLVLLDTVFPKPGTRGERPDARRRLSTYDDRDTARQRFRLMPPQPRPHPSELTAIADYALRQRDGRWAWKFDPEALGRYQDSIVDAALHQVTCPVTYMFGGRSALPSRQAARRVSAVVPTAEIVCVEDGYHHLPLDSPREVAETIISLSRRVRASR